MYRSIQKLAVAAMMGAVFTLASCTSDQKEESAKTPPAQTNTPVANSAPAGSSGSASTVVMLAGEAGGLGRSTFNPTATRTAHHPTTPPVPLTRVTAQKGTF